MGVPVTRINKIGEGSPHVVDLIRERALRPGDQHPDRLRRPRRRLRDPHRRGPPRHPLRDDDDRRLGGRAGDRRPAARATPRSARLQEIHEAPPPRSAAAERLTAPMTGAAPFGRRLCEVVENRASGGYRVFSLLDAEGPEPRAGQFYMLAARAALGAGRRAPFLPRASRSPTRPPRTAGLRLDFLVEAVGPGTDRLCALEPGERLWVNGPLGNAVLDAARARARRRRGDPRRRRHRHRAAGDPAPPASPTAASRPGPARLPRPRATPAASTTSSPAARSASPARTATPATAATSPTCSRRCSRATTPAAPPSTPAARRRCSRRCARSAPSAGVACELAMESPMACGFGACFGCAVPLAGRRLHAPLRRRAGGRRRRDRDGAGRGVGALMTRRLARRPLRDRARAPGHQRLGDLRRDRRPAGLRRRAARATSRSPPSSRRRSRPSRGPATRRRGSGRRRRG